MLYATSDVVGFTSFVIELYKNGEANIGSLKVKPDTDILARSPGDSKWPSGYSVNDPLDWMILVSLRDSENIGLVEDFDDPEDQLGGITMPNEIENWLGQVYTEVIDETNLFSCKDSNHLTSIVDSKHSNGYKCVLLINADMFSGKTKKDYKKNKKFSGKIGAEFPNHYVVYENNMSVSGNNITFDVWTWGSTKTVNVTKDIFNKTYYGALFAK